MSNFKTGVGTQDIILGLIWGGTPHIRIGLDTAHYSESGMDTAHNTTHYSLRIRGAPHKKMCSDIYTGVGTPHITSHTTQNQGGTPHMKMCLDVQTGVGTPHRIQRHRGGGHHTKSK